MKHEAKTRESYQTNAQVTTHFIFQGNKGLWLQQSHITRNRRINTRDLDCGLFSQLSLFSEAEVELDQRGTAPIPICLFQKRVGFWNKTQAWERGRYGDNNPPAWSHAPAGPIFFFTANFPPMSFALLGSTLSVIYHMRVSNRPARLALGMWQKNRTSNASKSEQKEE